MHGQFSKKFSNLLFLPLIGLLPACQESPSSLEPKGPGASAINELWWVLLVIAGIVYIAVQGLLFLALLRGRLDSPTQSPEEKKSFMGSESFVLVGGFMIPSFILAGVFIYTLVVMNKLSPDQDETPLTIEVIGHQFWWEVIYPDHAVITANEIHIPVGEPVELKITSADVIHSFWVPELHGKVDMLPGDTNTLIIEADVEGEYRGQCAEFCGMQHAHMAFLVIADNSADFESWLTQQQEPARPPPADSELFEGQQVFLGSACVYCHAVEGTNATSRFGPDLTHFGSRQTIGAGALPNTRGHLAGWIVDSQAVKPGNKMPPMYLDADDLQVLLLYLESLK